MRLLTFLLALVALAASDEIPRKMSPHEIGPQNAAVRLSDYQGVRYVAASVGSDRNGDGSARKPWASVSHALSRLADAAPSKRYAVLVAGGTYGDTVKMREYVDVFGGFEAKGWSRDIFAHPSTLDGQQKHRVVIGANNARLDGFVITGGKAQSPGGAILCDRTSPTITNNTITRNTTIEPADFIRDMIHQIGNDGGAIACLNGAAPMIANNVIADNTTGVGGGGAIGCRNQSAPTIVNNVMGNNTTGLNDKKRSRSSNGGAISCAISCSPKIINNVIANNRVGGNSDAGGIYCEYDSSPEIVHNYLVGNVAEDDGGAIYTANGHKVSFSTT